VQFGNIGCVGVMSPPFGIRVDPMWKTAGKC